MAGFRLFADFNRSGSVERTGAERAARNLDPGVIVAANLDNDRRALPASVSAGSAAVIDCDRDAKPSNDNEPATLLLAPERGAGQHDLLLSIFAWLAPRVRLLDEHKRVLRPALGTPGRYDLGATAAERPLFVEARTLAGSPLVGIPSLTPRRFEARRTPPERDERRFTVSLSSRPLAGGDLVSDAGTFTIAPWMMVDGTAPLERLYIVSTDDNHPSVADVRAALPNPAVLVVVPNDVATNDTWLQDQFELGCFHTPQGVSLALLHMPRLRRNYLGRGTTTGLPNFVRSHFPSRDVGVFDDFWQRTLPVDDVGGNRVALSFEESAKVREALVRPFLLRRVLRVIAFNVLETNPLRGRDGRLLTPPPSADLGERIALSQAVRDTAQWTPLVAAALDREIAGAPSERADVLRGHKQDMQSRAALAAQAVQVQAGGIRVTARDAPAPGQASGRVVWTADISDDMADRLEERLRQMHASQNYGGNLELGPPTDDAPFGRIFVGNGEGGREGFVDTELLNFLEKQRVQPLAQVDTSWLAVAHIDEIFSFVPSRAGGASHAVVLNSPKLALDILDAALRHHIAGLPSVAVYVDRPSGVLKRELNDGTSPITAMFRGKRWAHSHVAGTPEVQEPPQLYRVMAEHYLRGLSVHDTPWRPGPGPDRSYPAAMTVRELLWFESVVRLQDPNGEAGDTLSTNEVVEQEKLGYLRAQLEDLYPNLRVVPVPTIYDVVTQPGDSTGAYTPNLANLVVADDRVLVPRPFAPRVRPVDAVAIITRAFQDNGLEALLSGLSERWLRAPANRLLGVTQWFRTEDLPGSGTDLEQLARAFKDGFPGMSQTEVESRILRANRGHFRDGRLRSGWHQLAIPEDTVDLFEVAATLAVRSLGIGIRFVDSWPYHITAGEIHCGTNAIRRPSFRGKPRWWEYYFRPPQPAAG